MPAVISCVMPVYNAEKYLPAAVESVLGQNYPYFELILLHDGSTDRSYAICGQLSRRDDRVRLLSQPNGGAAAARNAGLAAASGRYLTFVDADDILKPGAFDAIARAAASSPDLISYGFEWREGEKSTPAVYPAFQCGLDDFWAHFVGYYQANQFFSLCNKAYKLETVRRAGLTFDRSLRTGEDIAFNFAFWPQIGKMAHLGESLYEYWVHPATLTHAATLDNLITSQRVLDQMEAFVTAAGHPELAAPLIESQRPHDAVSFYTLLLDRTKPYPLAKRKAALTALFENEVWYPALLKGLAGIPGLYGQYLRLAARRKSPALACLPLQLRGAK